ncbi:MAG: OmpA family protein, partial [Chitinophagaceae bacterium]
VRYMFNPKFGLKLGLGYAQFKPSDESADFDTKYYRADLEGVINAGRVMNFEEWTNTIGLLFHAGAGYYMLKPDQENALYDKDNGMNFLAGLTAQIKLSNRIVFTLDGTFIADAFQKSSFDGFSSGNRSVIDGAILNASAGLTFYLGGNEVHADWYSEGDKMKEQLDNLEKRVGELETLTSDADKDGVFDGVDSEPNTPTGVAVDSKGRAVDTNNNGVPDELENYLTKTYGDPTKSGTNGTNASGAYVPNSELIRNLINEGYVTTYFDFNKTKPTNVSTEGIDFILTYLRNNPSANVEIIGHADELGRTPYNDKLSQARAESVKEVLTRAKVSASRIKIVPAGEDTSVDKESAAARKLVRRVTFRVN